MKKIFRITIFVFTLCMLSLVYAGEARLDKINVDAVCMPNGDMQVTETLLFDISGDLNGLYRDILLSSKNKYGASGLEVHSVTVDGKKFEYCPVKLSLGDSGKYNLNSIDGGKQIKIYVPSSDTARTVELKYILKDVVLLHNDVAELHWDFIGSGWNNRIKDVEIKISLPDGSTSLRGWGHGPLNGTVEIVDNKTVLLKAHGINSNTEITARVVTDNTMFNGVKKVYDTNALDTILEEEEVYAAQANAKRKASKYAFYTLILAAVLTVFCPIIWYNKKKKEIEVAEFDGKYYRELPQDYGPAVMADVLDTIGYASVMPATIMNLARKGHVKITEIKNKKGKTDDYMLQLIDKEKLQEDDTLADNEKYFALEMLFEEKMEFTLDEFKKKFKKSSEQTKAVSKHKAWIERVKEDAKNYGEYKGKDSPSALKGCLKYLLLPIIANLVSIYLGVRFGYDDSIGFGCVLIYIQAMVFSIVGVILTRKLRYTKKGINHRKMWFAFASFLEDFSKLEDYPVQSLVIWEHYLVYAVALGKAKKVISQLELMYPTELTDVDNNFYTNYMVLSLCRNSDSFNSFNKTFNSAVSSAFSPQSSGSGGGGGFSGGGGSGGGGGGGGGF